MKARSSLRRAAERLDALREGPGALAALRVGVAGVMLAKALVEWDSFERIYGGAPLAPWALSELTLPPGAPRTSVVADLFARHGVSHGALASCLWAAYVGGLSLLLPGLFTRPAAAVACVAHLLLHNGGSLAAYGVDSLANVGLFYCAVLPVGGAASLDRRLGLRPPADPATVGIGLLVLRVHLCLAYGSSGFAKASGDGWWSGDALWRAVMQPQFAQFDLGWLARVPWMAQAAGLATVAIECGYPFFVWQPSARRLWLALVVGMHLGIAVAMGLWFFSGVMIALNLAALGEFAGLRFRDPAPGLRRE